MGSSSIPSGRKAYNILPISRVANIVGVVKGDKINVENFIAPEGGQKEVKNDKHAVSMNGVVKKGKINDKDFANGRKFTGGNSIDIEGKPKVIAGNLGNKEVIGESTYRINPDTEVAGNIGTVDGGKNTIKFSTTTQDKPEISIEQGSLHKAAYKGLRENRLPDGEKAVSEELGGNHYFSLKIQRAGIVGVLKDGNEKKEIKAANFKAVENGGKIIVANPVTTQGKQTTTKSYNISTRTEVAGIIGVVNGGRNTIENCTATSGAPWATQAKYVVPATGIVGVINGGTNYVG